MVVLAVMGVLVSAALPNIGDGFADRRVAMVAREVTSLFQRARYMSMAYGRAHQVVYENDGGFGLGGAPYAFETRRGTSGGCALTSFENAGGTVLANMNCGANWRCVDSIYPDTYDSDPGDTDLIRVDGFNNATFCYEAGSNNQVFIESVLYSNWQVDPVQSGFGFLVYREVDGSVVGVTRKVLIPSGTGTPRILR
jgi:type II secretory pathway pseudopilin PulG